MALRLTNFDRAVFQQRRLFRQGDYLTNGRDLFHVVRTLGPGGQWSLFELEDCRTLKRALRSGSELDRMTVWPVWLGRRLISPRF